VEESVFPDNRIKIYSRRGPRPFKRFSLSGCNAAVQ
jgi:hypothetical protein